jgi:hypothetical protein
MGQGALVIDEGEKDAGGKLIDQFSKKWPVKAAFGVKPSDADQWSLYIAAAGIDDTNIGQGYKEVLRLIKKLQTPYFDAFQVRLVKSDDPVVRAVMEVHERYARVKVSPIHYNGRYLGGMSIEGAYLYPLPNILDQTSVDASRPVHRPSRPPRR